MTRDPRRPRQPVHTFRTRCRNLALQTPNVTFHFTPKGSSWLNQVETWFGIITRQAIRRGTFKSVRQLINIINTYITSWNQGSQPFSWTATANEIITKVRLVHQDFKNLLDNNDNTQ
jgi:transposase